MVPPVVSDCPPARGADPPGDCNESEVGRWLEKGASRMVRPTRTALRCLACLLALALPNLALGDMAYTVDSGWQDFSWGKKAPLDWNEEGKFTFSSTKDMVLKVTDAWESGDRFAVFN